MVLPKILVLTLDCCCCSVDLFFSKLFALLRGQRLTADLGGPIIMAQVDNEYGLFGTDQAYLQYIRKSWRDGLGEGVVIHSTDPARPVLLPFLYWDYHMLP